MSKTLTKEALLAASEDDYMNDEQLEFFQALLNDLKQQTMAHIEEMKASLSQPPEINDEVDRAQYEEESRLSLDASVAVIPLA